MTNKDVTLVLASGSKTRRALLEAAGIAVEVDAPDIDERALRDDLFAADPTLPHAHVARALAVEKARIVSLRVPKSLVIGADQVLSFEARLFEKPSSIGEARDCLMQLRGKTHALHSAVALAENGDIVWHDTVTALLTMRSFSERALDQYLQRAGASVLTSVGAYQIEGTALQLFETVEGDHTTILGLPMLPLMAELLRREVLTR